MSSVSHRSLFPAWMVLALATAASLTAAGLEMPIGSAAWTFEGTHAQEYLGYAVSYAGDLNGDDYEDFVVGAPGFDQGIYTSTGRAWVFYGSAVGPSSIPDVTLTPTHPRNFGSFGEVVGWAGNVNGDDYDDLLVGMLNYSGDPFVDQQGGVFVYYGSDTGISTTPDWVAMGEVAQLHFGDGAGTAGDVNGDDYDDIIVGSWNGAWVYYGSADGLDNGSRPVGLPGNADWSVTNDGSADYLGLHVGMAGDVNGDNYSDVWVADPFYDNGEDDEGKVFVWYGSSGGLGATGTPANADWAVESNDALSYTGGEGVVPSATSLGDVNGDDYDDFLVAAAKYDVVDREGLAMLFYGSPEGLDPDGSRPLGTPTNADWTLAGANEVDILGWSVGRAGDFNDDGFNDFLIGVFSHDATGNNGEGMAQLWLGSSDGPKPGSLPRHVDCFVEGSQQGEHVGTTVAGAGDVNGDGFDDLLSGAIYWDITDPSTIADAGRVYLFLGQPLIFAEDYESGDLWRYSVIVD